MRRGPRLLRRHPLGHSHGFLRFLHGIVRQLGLQDHPAHADGAEHCAGHSAASFWRDLHGASRDEDAPRPAQDRRCVKGGTPADLLAIKTQEATGPSSTRSSGGTGGPDIRDLRAGARLQPRLGSHRSQGCSPSVGSGRRRRPGQLGRAEDVRARATRGAPPSPEAHARPNPYALRRRSGPRDAMAARFGVPGSPRKARLLAARQTSAPCRLRASASGGGRARAGRVSGPRTPGRGRPPRSQRRT